MQYIGGSLYQGVSLESIVNGLTGATGVEGVILSNHADFTTKNTTATTKNTTQDNTLSSLETKAGSLETGATGLEGRNATLSSDFVTLQNREDALLAGLTGASGLEARAVGFNNNITSINANLNGNIQNQINTKVADSIFQSLKTEFETDFTTFQNQLNQKVVTATQEVIDARQDTDDAVLEKKFCSIEEFAQTFLQTYTVKKPDGTNYNFNGKIQKIDKAPPIFSIVNRKKNGTSWDLSVKLSDYGYNIMSGNIIVKNGLNSIVATLPKSLFNLTTKLYTLVLTNSNSNASLINGPYTFEYQTSTNVCVYMLTINASNFTDIPQLPVFTYSVSTSYLKNSSITLTPTSTGGSIASYSGTSLPSGLTINTLTGAITGSISTTGTYNFTIRGTNNAGFSDVSISLVINPEYNIDVFSYYNNGENKNNYINIYSVSSNSITLYNYTSSSVYVNITNTSIGGTVLSVGTVPGTSTYNLSTSFVVGHTYRLSHGPGNYWMDFRVSIK